MRSPFPSPAAVRSFRPPPPRHVAVQRRYTRPAFASRPALDLKHMRQNPGLYEQNCLDRNYAAQSRNAWEILALHEQTVELQRQAVGRRQRSNELTKRLAEGKAGAERDALLDEARALKAELSELEEREKGWQAEMERLALELPNLSSLHTPSGAEPEIIDHIGERPAASTRLGKSHVDIGRELDILDFEASATTSGWGWYFLRNEGALLEQALVQYALSVAIKRGWTVVTPPSLVYAHVASACGFMPRDANGETQIYPVAQSREDVAAGKPALVLTGTAEIPFAGSKANTTLSSADLPLKIMGPSRCYRAEAGARGVDTKGLYRVHEFTKVEMFAWTLPQVHSTTSRFGDVDARPSQAEHVFDEMVGVQKEILGSLGLHARVLEQPSHDLGASASRKIDIEAYFPSRAAVHSGYGEVTSASICTDYQTRRLATRLKNAGPGAGLAWPHTVNGTAVAVPRVLACVLENHWDDAARVVRVPEILRPFMLGGISTIGPAGRIMAP